MTYPLSPSPHFDSRDPQPPIDADEVARLRAAGTQPRRPVTAYLRPPLEGQPSWVRDPDGDGAFVPLDAPPLGNLGLATPSILTGDGWVPVTVGMYLSQTRGVGAVAEEVVKVSRVTRFGWRGVVVASGDAEDLGEIVVCSRCDCLGWRIKHVVGEIAVPTRRAEKGEL